jgi:hypothetical protein
MTSIFSNVTLSTTNYDALLIGWNTDTSAVAGDGIDDIPTGITFSGGNSTYCDGESAWNELDTTHGWTITDNGLSCDIYVSPKIYLQGPINNPTDAGLMNDDLRDGGYIPTTSPYTDVLTCDSSVFDLGGTSGTGTIDDDIVDWVWIELRDENDNTSVIDSQSALLQRDGDIVGVDGISELSFSQSSGNYFVSIAHRNHIGIITASAISLSSTSTSVGLATSTVLINGGTNAVYDLGDGTYALFSGDYDSNGQVQNLDLSNTQTLLGSAGYSDADFDLNAQVQNTDINNSLSPNIGNGAQFSRTANQLLIIAPLSEIHQNKKQ